MSRVVPDLPESAFHSCPESTLGGLTRVLPEDAFVKEASRPGPSWLLSTAEKPRLTAGLVGQPREPRGTANGYPGSEPGLPRPGSIIDRYRIEEAIGRGGFGVVYRATHLILKSPVAIKILRPSILKKCPGLASSLCDEARFAARINHVNVVRVHDVTSTEEITYAVMEYVDGSSLAQILEKRGRLPPLEVIRIGIDVARGLRAGLQQGLIHRDIKPGNILIGRDGTVKIVDFGLAHPLEAAAGDRKAPARRGLVGTEGYAAPEQLLAPDSIDFRADIHGLGAALYHAAVGELPFSSERRPREEAPVPESRIPAFPAGFSRLLRRTLAWEPEDRPESYDALVQELRTLHGELTAFSLKRTTPDEGRVQA